MRDWDLKPPPEVDLKDRQVPKIGHHLDGRRIALLITGGIAAMRAPLVARSLRRYGAEVVQIAWFLARGEEPVKLTGKGKMAEAIVGHPEHRSFTNTAPTG